MEKHDFLIEKVLPDLGKLNALLKNQTSQMDIKDPNEMVRRINSGEWKVVPVIKNYWEDKKNKVYRLSVVSGGTTGPEWIERLEKKNFKIEPEARMALLSSNFKPTKNVTREIVILKKDFFCKGEKRKVTNKDVILQATNKKLIIPHIEVACLIRELLSDKDLKKMNLLSIVIMHNPVCINVESLPKNFPIILAASRHNQGNLLNSFSGETDNNSFVENYWDAQSGFAFVLSQAYLSEDLVKKGWSLKFDNSNLI